VSSCSPGVGLAPAQPTPLGRTRLRTAQPYRPHSARLQPKAPQWIYFVYPSAAVVKVKVQAWGNSLGLRIPKVYANALGVGSGSEMELKMEDGALLARPAEAIHLEALLAEITAENQHSSTDWGDGSGGEAW